MPTTTFTEDLVVGFAQLLAEASIGFTYPATGDPSEVGIYAMVVPQSPDRVVTLSPVPYTAHPTLSQSMYGLQVRSRSTGQDPRDVWALDDAVGSVLLGYFPVTLPSGLRVSSLVFQGGGSLGQDQNDRWMWSSNYLLNVNRQSAHRS